MSVRHYLVVATAAALLSTPVSGHGDGAPQPVDTKGLPENGDDWLDENPYRADKVGVEIWAKAVRIGDSGYNQNCARCHGLEAVSGGLAPDVRYLSADIDGDEWYVERFREGKTQGGVTKMPAFGELLGQDAAWAIRTYIETRPDDGALDDFSDQLKGIRDDLIAKSDALEGGSNYDSIKGEIDVVTTALEEISAQVETGSGAPVADSAASRALASLDGTAAGVKSAAENLTVGLSAAQ